VPTLTNTVTPAAPAVTCDAVRADVFAAIDGELDAAALGVIDLHIAACPLCRQQLTADAVFHAAVRRALALDSAPQSLRDRVALLLQARTTEITPA
jgi:mycothiol system anti-sigma-R factor